MQISDTRLRNRVRDCLRSDKFQKELMKNVEYYKVQTNIWTMSDLLAEIHELKSYVKHGVVNLTSRELTGASAFSGISPDNLLSHRITNIEYYKPDPKYITFCKVLLYFNPVLVKRQSLRPQWYPKGVTNIVNLLTNGWDYRSKQFRQVYDISRYWGKVYGTWKVGGQKLFPVHAISYRQANSSLFNDVAAYNIAKNKEGLPIHAELTSKYISVLPFREDWRDITPKGINTIYIGLHYKFN